MGSIIAPRGVVQTPEETVAPAVGGFTLCRVDVWDYFQSKEKEFRELRLTPDRDFGRLFAEEAGSNGRRGRIFGAVLLDCEADAFLGISIDHAAVPRKRRASRRQSAARGDLLR
jgi:hypothetical protein